MNDEVCAAAHRLTADAVEWLHRGRHHGDLDPARVAVEPDGRYKAILENALAASLVLREQVAGPAQRQAATDLLDHGWEQLREGTLLYERLLRHPTLTDPTEVYAHFARAGYRHAALDDLLPHVTSLRPARTQELLPNRKLAVLNSERILGLPLSADLAQVTESTWLAAKPEPWTIDWMTAYHVTHTVFHVTDWGARPADLPADLDDYLRLWLPLWVDVWTETAQWDLVGELLIVDSCLRAPVCPAEPWLRLRQAQRPDGALPRDALPGPVGESGDYRHQQHPSVVATIAGTLGLSRRLTLTPAVP